MVELQIHQILRPDMIELDIVSIEKPLIFNMLINKVYLAEGRDTHILSEIPGSVNLIPPVRIDPNVSIGQSVQIGPNVYVESGAAVGDGAVLENTLVLKGASVPVGGVCSNEIIAPRARIAHPRDE